MSLNKSDTTGVIPPTVTKRGSVDEDFVVRRQIQRRNVYKDGGKRDRNSLRVSLSHHDSADHKAIPKSAPGSGRTSPTDLLSVSMSTPKTWTPISMTTPAIEAKVVILGAQGE